MKYFPVFLDLKDRKVLVVGNGPETEQKLKQVLSAGARVQFLSKHPPDFIKSLARHGKIDCRQGNFQGSDLNDVWLVISTSQDNKLNERITRAARQRRIFHNIVDVAHLCAYITPAVVSQGDIQIAISTGGKSPALAQRLKKEIDALLDPAYAELAKLLGELREKVLRTIPGFEERKKLFHSLANSELLELFRNRQNERARQRALDIIEQATR